MAGDTFIEGDIIIDNNSLKDKVNIGIEQQDVINVDSIEDTNGQLTQKFCACNGSLKPCTRIQFDDLEGVETCYKAYSRQNDYTCSREGFRQKDCQKSDAKCMECAEIRIGCKVVMGLKNVEAKWIVSKFEDKHNHELLTPRSTIKNLVAITIMVEIKKKLFEKGHAQRLYKYFKECQTKILVSFIYMGNCFWANGRSRMAYQYFRDVVTFDAKYLTNQYFHHCIHDTITTEEFELEWNEIICKFIYSSLKVGACIFKKIVLCQNVNNTMDTLVSDFINQYEQALNARYVKEKEKDVKTMNSKAILRTYYNVEVVNLMKMESDAFFRKEGSTYAVAFTKSNKKAICSCHKFEFVWILCSHFWAVFVKKSLVKALDPQYVLERWTMNSKKRVVDGNFGDVI
ncbi:hypothetical protein CXB51_014235 [Gossypium anomalum]|uniref:Protein FAR1-RELATED SEQUENCE n=1 Tax=Gossypium anomalum TaxID=47600 RepID=A0A8J6CXH4_9ROSI|nr:hypothetical protein CXB51_014235 [Gossypium anomalum]